VLAGGRDKEVSGKKLVASEGRSWPGFPLLNEKYHGTESKSTYFFNRSTKMELYGDVL
jgi:hypothetical protein